MTSGSTVPGRRADTTSRRGLLVGFALGLPVVAYGVRGALVDAADTHPAALGRWIVGTAVLGDLVLVPLALGVGTAARRLTPRWAWPAVRTGLIVTGALFLVAWPFVRGYGRDPTTPSLLNRPYGAGLAVAVASLWAGVALWLAAAGTRRRRRRRIPHEGVRDRLVASPRLPGRSRRGTTDDGEPSPTAAARRRPARRVCPGGRRVLRRRRRTR